MVIANHVHLVDSGRHQVDLRLHCTGCEEPFLFAEGIPVGIDLSGDTGAYRSSDRQELRVAVTTALEEVPRG